MKVDFDELPALAKLNMPIGFKENYKMQSLIQPNDPVLVVKNEGKISSTIMLWGLTPNWSLNPLNGPRPYNAKAETINEKKIFRNCWRHKRCLLPATGFLEKKYLIKKKNSAPFWLAGIWEKWMSNDGSELETCCIITTKPNNLIRPIHTRMPVIIENDAEKRWLANQNSYDLKELETYLLSWESQDWIKETINSEKKLVHSKYSQTSLF